MFVVALFLGSFNILTIVVVLRNHNLRTKVSNYPILSFLIGSAIQGLVAAPIYAHKKVHHEEESWVCDAYRLPYFYCGHVMKASLMIVSLDRLLAVKYPFKYERFVKKTSCIIVLVAMWVVTIGIDIVPFFEETNEATCTYTPTKTWGLLVILIYNIFPFVVIGYSYLRIWFVAAKFSLMDRRRRTISSTHVQLTRTDSPCLQRKEGKECPRYHLHISEKLDAIKLKLEMKATITSTILLSVYIVCWGPIGVTYMVDHFCDNCISNNKDLDTFRAVIKYLCFSSSLLAPLVYCWMNREYRSAAVKMLRCSKKKNDNENMSCSKKHKTSLISNKSIKMKSKDKSSSLLLT